MIRTRFSAMLTGVALCLALAATTAPRAHAADYDLTKGWTVELKTKSMFSSHTSYEFKNPFPPGQLLSRLQFPMKSVWAGAEVRKELGRFSTGVEYLSSVQNQESGRFNDTDWDDDTSPKRMTNYGNTGCTLRDSFQATADVDMQIADMVGLPPAFAVRPVLGFRMQRLRFMAHDGLQYDYNTPGAAPVLQSLPGNTIAFEQYWYMPFIGLRLGYEWDNPPLLRRVKLSAQGDWSYTTGHNRDEHLLRGDRVTYERTVGNAWHAAAGVVFGLTEHFHVGLDADYLRIETRGTHHLDDSTNAFTFTWSDGVRAWSEQSSVMVKLGYTF